MSHHHQCAFQSNCAATGVALLNAIAVSAVVAQLEVRHSMPLVTFALVSGERASNSDVLLAVPYVRWLHISKPPLVGGLSMGKGDCRPQWP